MSIQRENWDREFVGDDGAAHELVPSAVIAAVPEAKDAAEGAGQALRMDFLGDRAVLWMLEQRRVDNLDKQATGLVFGLPTVLIAIAIAMWPFWDVVASQKPQQFQLLTMGGATALMVVLMAFFTVKVGRATFDPVHRNVRIRARYYRKIVVIARQGGADVPLRYPFYGMYASSRKFFPEAEDLPAPEAQAAD